ncbi:hypothetical protein ACTA71_007181 [Dictyostelium dimigraforme]
MNKGIIISIEIGDQYSSFSFAFVNDSSKMIFIPEFYDTFVPKTLTKIVLNENKKLVAFGNKADEYFNNDNHRGSLYSFYRMKLFDQVTRSKPIKSDCGKDSATIHHLYSETLRYLKECTMKKINSMSCQKVEERDIQWIITIPMVFDYSCEQVIRSCADAAGLCPKDDRDSLIFLYEPEACAIDCIFEKTSRYSVEVGQKLMVIDNGCSVSNINIFKQLEGGKLEVIYRPFGGCFGSNDVNKAFRLFLKELLGKDDYKRRKTNFHFQNLFEGFGHLKSYDTSINYPIHENEEWFIKKVNDNLRTRSNLRYSSVREKLIIPKELFDSFFKMVFNKITDLIKNEMKLDINIKKLDYILLVGSFNGNMELQEHIKSELKFTGANFIVPRRPSLSVLRGATLFGLNSISLPRSRIMGDSTSGITISSNFGTTSTRSFSSFYGDQKHEQLLLIGRFFDSLGISENETSNSTVTITTTVSPTISNALSATESPISTVSPTVSITATVSTTATMSESPIFNFVTTIFNMAPTSGANSNPTSIPTVASASIQTPIHSRTLALDSKSTVDSPKCHGEIYLSPFLSRKRKFKLSPINLKRIPINRINLSSFFS